MKNRHCERCGIAEQDTPENMLAGRDGQLVCSDCDSDMENEWVAQDPDNNQHYLDTFSPYGGCDGRE